MAKLLHVSSNTFPPLEIEHTTKKIWRELAKGFDEYHIIARAKNNRFYNGKEGNIYLHLVPNLYSTKSFFISSLHMVNIINKYNIDILLAQCPILGGALATYISKKKKIPIMIEIHGMEYFRILDGDGLINRLASVLIRYSLTRATKIRSLGQRMTEMLVERGIKSNISEIPNRVNIDIFKNPKKDNILSSPIKVVSVGRFVWEKGYDIAIEAITNLQNHYDIELTLIGGGPLKDTYKKIINNNERIKLIEWLPQESFVPMLRSSDIYIQPSLSEGMPRSILEAMAMQLPVITTNVGTIPSVIEDQKNGILINPKSVAQLEDAVNKVIEDSEMRSKLAKNGHYDVVNKYEWNVVFERYRNELLIMKDLFL